MITKQELREVLQKYRFEEKQIDRILNKKIKILLKNGNKDKIDTILQILLNNSISRELIEKCLTVLATGKAKEIEDIFKVLKDNKISTDIIHNNLGFLLLNSLQEIQTIFTEGNVYLKRYMQLKGYYDKVISEAEIQEICKEKK